MEFDRLRIAQRMKLAGRIIGFAMIGFGGTMLIDEAVHEFMRPDWRVITETELAGVLLVVIGIIALTGCILSWRKLRIAGILLIASSAALGGHIATYTRHNKLLTWAMVGLPFLVAGALLLISWRLFKVEGYPET